MRKLSQTEELVKILAGRARRHTLTPEQISRAMDEQEYDVSGLDALYAALEARGIRVTEEEADMPMLDETQIGELEHELSAEGVALDDPVKAYLKEIGRVPLLTMEQELELARAAQAGDQAACGQLVEENQGLIWSIVRRYARGHLELDDLYQLGCLGFLKAVQGFDLAFGTQFSTYAVPKIAGEIRRFLRDDGPVKVGRTMREKGQTLWAARERLQGRLGCEPKLSQLAAETGMTPEEIAAVDLALIAPDSLQQETAEGLTLESTLCAEEPSVSLVERIALRDAIDALPEKERKTILLRFFKGLTQEQTARILQVSQVQVSRLERRSLQKLRDLLAEE